MLLLALDTASPAVTVAVHDGHRVVATRTTVDARRHGELLAPALAAVMAEAGAGPHDLTDVAVGVGPGPYTGLRVGLITARTTASVVGAALHGVCSLDVIALEAAPGEPFAVVTDARRHEVHWARYDAAGHRVEGPAVDRPADLAARLPPGTTVVGRGGQLYAEQLAGFRLPHSPLDPAAAVLASAVVDGAAEVVPAEPLYLRRPDATPPGPAKPVLPPSRW